MAIKIRINNIMEDREMTDKFQTYVDSIQSKSKIKIIISSNF